MILDAALAPDPLAALPQPSPYTRADAIDLMVRGGYPEIGPLEGRERANRYDSYLDSIVARDVAQLWGAGLPEQARRREIRHVRQGSRTSRRRYACLVPANALSAAVAGAKAAEETLPVRPRPTWTG